MSAVLGRRGRGGREVRGRGGRGAYGQGGSGLETFGGGGQWGESVGGRGRGGRGGYGQFGGDGQWGESVGGRGRGGYGPPPNNEFGAFGGRGARGRRGRGEGGREFGRRGRGNFQERGRGGFSQRGWRGRSGYGGDDRRGFGVAGRGQRGRGAGEVGGIRGAYGSQGVAIRLEDEQQQAVFVRGHGGFNERGGAGRGRVARGVRGGVRGKEKQWDSILSQAYGGHTSHGGETVGGEKQDSWSDSYQSGSYDNDFSGDGFHGNRGGGFHGNRSGGDNSVFQDNDSRSWSGERGGEEWNRDHVKLEFGSETAVCRGGKGEEGHRGRGWGGHTQEHTPYDRFSDPPHVGPPGASSEQWGGWEKGEGGRWGGSSDGIGHSDCPPLLGASPLPPVEHSKSF